jgi:hypothetical protein
MKKKLKSCNIIATGESLNGFDLRLIDKCRKDNICINNSFKHVLCDHLVYWDENFYPRAAWHDRYHYSLAKNVNKYRRYIQLRQTNEQRLSFEQGKVCNINLSGFMAINVAVHLGYKRIYLFGYDGGCRDNVHFYKDNTSKESASSYKDYNHLYHTFRQQADENGIEIINVINPLMSSFIDAFETIAFEDYIKACV